jgi:hypothetical protein
MTYLVIALGALLSLCGALAIAWGYPIVQVERGWALVIAGAMAFSCGIVTIALGLILRRLSKLQELLTNGRGETPLPRDLGMAAAGEPHAGHSQVFGSGPVAPSPAAAAAPSPPPVVSGPRAWPQRPARHVSARNALKPRPAVAPPPASARDLDEEDSAVPLAREESRRASEETPPLPYSAAAPETEATIPAEPHDVPWPSLEEEMQGERAMPHGAVTPEAVGRPDTRQYEGSEQEGEAKTSHLDFEEHPPVSPAHGEPRPDAGAADEAAAIEAILREELRVSPDLALAAQGKQVEPSPEPLDAAGPNPQTPAASPQQALTPELGAAISGETLTIAGRYESQGTSYIMYSDGSIEARTDNTVIHFKSMSELKRFMEQQAQGSHE